MKFPTPFSQVLRSVRLDLGLSQGVLSARCGISVFRISDFERGSRLPSTDQIEQLARGLGVAVSVLKDGSDWISSEERAQIRKASSTVRKMFERTFQYVQPRDRETMIRLKMALAKYRDLARELLYLVVSRYDGGLVLRMLCEVVVGSSLEMILHLLLLAAGARLVRVAPLWVGFRQHPVVNPETRESVGDCEVPAYQLTLDGGMLCLLTPQVGVSCRRSTWCLDFLCAVIDERGAIHWINIEIDGDGHDSTSDLQRTADIDMLTVRLTERDIFGEEPLSILAERIRATIKTGKLAA